MAKKTKALSKGLAQIFGDDFNSVLGDIQEGKSEEFVSGKAQLYVSLIKSNPYQPRKHFDEAKLQELADSIKEHGVFTPILVKQSSDGYELIAGERRLRASILANKTTIPAIIMEFDDQQMMEIALLENVQREDLNPIEEALGYQKLIERLNYTQEELSKRIGKSREYVTNILRLLKLPKVLQDYVIDGSLSNGHARCLLALKDENKMIEVAKQVIAQGMSVRALEQLVKKLLSEKKEKEDKVKVKDGNIQAVEKRLSDIYQSKVVINNKKIMIHFNDDHELNRLLELLGGLEEEL